MSSGCVLTQQACVMRDDACLRTLNKVFGRPDVSHGLDQDPSAVRTEDFGCMAGTVQGKARGGCVQ